MRFFLLSFLIFSSPLFAVTPGLESARELADRDIIVNQSAQAEQYYAHSTSTTPEYQEARLYRLDDILIRQEAMTIALKLRGVTIPTNYFCRGYFRDVSESWVCRAVELAADYGIVTRANTWFRPHDSLTLAEALKIIMVALEMPMTTSDSSLIPGTIPSWQKRIILTLREKNINPVLYDAQGRVVASFLAPRHASVSVNLSHKMTRGEFFQLVLAFLREEYTDTCYDYRYSSCPSSCQAVCQPSGCSGNICTADCEGPNSCVPKYDDPVAHCTIYNDGCNDCVRGDEGVACTKRACVWQGTPWCSECEGGYTLNNGRCVKQQNTCVSEGGYAGGGEVMVEERPGDFICCSGLTRAERADGSTFADAGYTCIRQGDNYCDSRYESALNSSDCPITACVKEGGVVSNYSFPPEYRTNETCCSGLTSVGSKDAVVGGSNICANIGDGYCDSRYESTLNSTDCQTTIFDPSICQSYYDGCNICSNTSGSNTMCTLMYCAVSGPAYCKTYRTYIPINQTTDQQFSDKVLNEIRNYTKDLSCTTSSQCDWKLFGRSPCGGSSVGIKYSSKNIDMTLFDSKTTYYTNMEILFNQIYSISGVCAIMTAPPPLSCISGTCQYQQ